MTVQRISSDFGKGFKHMYIETERLIIRSIKENDESAFAEMVADGSLNEDIFCGYEGDYHDWIKEWIQESMLLDKEDNPRKDYLAYAIADKTTDAPVGSVGCTFFDDTKEIGITYFIGTAFRGQGYAAEAAAAYADFFFAHYDELTLMANARTRNIASCKTLEKAGFSLLETKLYRDFGDAKEEPYNFYKRNRY